MQSSGAIRQPAAAAAATATRTLFTALKNSLVGVATIEDGDSHVPRKHIDNCIIWIKCIIMLS